MVKFVRYGSYLAAATLAITAIKAHALGWDENGPLWSLSLGGLAWLCFVAGQIYETNQRAQTIAVATMASQNSVVERLHGLADVLIKGLEEEVE